MDLLEYQAKKLFRQVGIPILPSETIADPRELKQLQIPYPVVLKSQVKVGGRGKAGGVKFVTNTIDAIAAARNIFNLSILGEYPQVILAEARYNVAKELFLAIVLDYQLQCPVIFGSISGGMDIKELVKDLQQVVVEMDFSPFMARRLAVQMGLSGDLLLAVSDIIGKMYRLFETKDLDWIEINPLGVDTKGNLMALDGKIAVSDAALARHPELIDLSAVEMARVGDSNGGVKNGLNDSLTVADSLKKAEISWLDWQNERGKIAILTNDRDLSLLCWDLIRQQKEKPACAIVMEDLPTLEQLQVVWEKLQSMRRIKVLLINFWGTTESHEAIAKMVFDLQSFFYPTASSTPGEERAIMPTNDSQNSVRRSSKDKLESQIMNEDALKVVIRLPEPDIELYRQKFARDDLFWTDDLDSAIAETFLLSKTR